MTNFIGLQKQGFVFDYESEAEVWNYPVFGYTTEIISESDRVYPGAARGTKRIIQVKSVVDYTNGFNPTWEPMPYSASAPQNARKIYLYNLELDGDGKIIGGEWLQGKGPDFLWTQTATNFGGFFSEVRSIYNASVDQIE